MSDAALHSLGQARNHLRDAWIPLAKSNGDDQLLQELRKVLKTLSEIHNVWYLYYPPQKAQYLHALQLLEPVDKPSSRWHQSDTVKDMEQAWLKSEKDRCLQACSIILSASVR